MSKEGQKQGSRPRILYVDDNKLVRDAYTRRLSSMDIALELATTGQGAIAALSTVDYDLVVTDLFMTGGSGRDILTWARKHRPNLPVILLSACEEMDLALMLMREGAADFVRKGGPWPLEEAIERALASSGPRQRTRSATLDDLAAMGVVSLNLARELENPLAYLSTSLHHLVGWAKEQLAGGTVEEMSEQDSDDLVSAIDDAMEGLLRASCLVKEITAVTRHSPSRRDTVYPDQLYFSATQLIEPRLLRRLAVDPDFYEGPAILGQEGPLREILADLLSQALRRGTPGGAPTAVRLSLELGDQVTLIIQDDGAGISARDLELAFDPLLSIDAALSSETGLSFSVARHVVTRMGGALEVISAADQAGCEVRITLPGAETTPSAVTPPRIGPRGGGAAPDFEEDAPRGIPQKKVI